MLVELDVFSGRPNPRWQLDERSSKELRQLEDRLTASTSAATDPPALGYRGFSYAYAAGSRRVYRGYVLTPSAVMADPSFSIERFLLERVPAEFASLRTRIASELGRLK